MSKDDLSRIYDELHEIRNDLRTLMVEVAQIKTKDRVITSIYGTLGGLIAILLERFIK